MSNAARAEPPSDAAWAFPVEWIRLNKRLKKHINNRYEPSRLLLTPPSPMFAEALPSDTVNHHTLSNSVQSLPARQLTFSTLRPESLTNPGCELPSHLSNSESWSPVGCRRGAPGQTTLPFPPRGRRDLPIHTASIFLPSDVGESLPATKLYLSVFTCLTQQVLSSHWTLARASQPDKCTVFILRPARPTQPRYRLTVRPSNHLTLPFCLNLSDSVSPNLPTDAGESTPGQTILVFQVPRSARLTRPTPRALVSRRMSARASQPDKLIFSVCSHHNIEPRRILHSWSVKQS